jgi:hypothetical protein
MIEQPLHAGDPVLIIGGTDNGATGTAVSFHMLGMCWNIWVPSQLRIKLVPAEWVQGVQ